MERLYAAAKEAGALALLFGSTHKDGKLTMLGSPFEAYFRDFLPPWPRMPFGFLQPEHAALLKRLLVKGEKVELELNLAGSASKGPVKAYNVVGEIRGTERPEEVVIIGGHLDSWDLGTGTTDNGTGCIAALEALRAIQAAGLKPKRTIRVVLFSGEEQGLCGSDAYVKAHADELAKIHAVLIDDFGGGKATGFLMQQREDLLPFMAKVIEPLAQIGVKNLPLTREDDSDHTPFVKQGVPAFFLEQESSEYFASTHHSQVDTFDHVKAEDFLQGVQTLTLAAWRLANVEAHLPHRRPAP
jgi:Zn-dependent M28 family amino/carboxypeptidase